MRVVPKPDLICDSNAVSHLKTISINLETTVIANQTYSIDMSTLLDRLIDLAAEYPRPSQPSHLNKLQAGANRMVDGLEETILDDRLTHDRFWGKMENVSWYDGNLRRNRD
jgi:hypothetical protein